MGSESLDLIIMNDNFEVICLYLTTKHQDLIKISYDNTNGELHILFHKDLYTLKLPEKLEYKKSPNINESIEPIIFIN